MTSDFTRTTVKLNGKKVTTLRLGSLKDIDLIEMEIWTPGQSYIVRKTGKEIKEKGGNIFFDKIEKMGKGLIRRHTIGLIRIGHSWRMEKTISEVQFYQHEKGLFTPFLLHQKEMLKSMEFALIGATDIPSYNEYREYTPAKGTVKWFNPFTLTGSIAGEEGDVFFHWNDVRSAYRHNCLKPGTKVDYYAIPATGSFKQKATYVIK